jgi:hypothetical protein
MKRITVFCIQVQEMRTLMEQATLLGQTLAKQKFNCLRWI